MVAITCLIENTSPDPRLLARHGLCLFIETEETSLVFDFGPDSAFADNAEQLGIDLSTADLAVLSHGHKDHGGGIPTFLALNPKAPIHLAASALDPCQGRLLGILSRQIGLDHLAIDPGRCRPTEADTRISPSLTLFTRFGFGSFVPQGNQVLFRQDSHGRSRPDDFSHEQALLIQDQGKTILITGCSHSGIAHMVQTVLDRTGLSTLDTVIGGFHLFNPMTRQTEPPARLDLLAQALTRFPHTAFYTGHCTGERAFARLKETLGDQLLPLSTGTRITL